MYKRSALMLVFLVSMPGCFLSKKNHNAKKEVLSHVDIPVAGDSVKSYFDDENIDGFVLADGQVAGTADSMNDYSWIDDASQSESFKSVYFDFDKCAIKETQKSAVVYDAQQAQAALQKGTASKIVAEGHCDLYGSPAYNFALSEKRAVEVANQLVAQGVPADSIVKIGRGQEMPVMIDGKPCSGTRDQQWLNRRVELHVIKA